MVNESGGKMRLTLRVDQEEALGRPWCQKHGIKNPVGGASVEGTKRIVDKKAGLLS